MHIGVPDGIEDGLVDRLHAPGFAGLPMAGEIDHHGPLTRSGLRGVRLRKIKLQLFRWVHWEGPQA